MYINICRYIYIWRCNIFIKYTHILLIADYLEATVHVRMCVVYWEVPRTPEGAARHLTSLEYLCLNGVYHTYESVVWYCIACPCVYMNHPCHKYTYQWCSIAWISVLAHLYMNNLCHACVSVLLSLLWGSFAKRDLKFYRSYRPKPPHISDLLSLEYLCLHICIWMLYVTHVYHFSSITWVCVCE